MQVNGLSNVQNTEIKNQPSFGNSSVASLGKKILSSDSFQKISDKFEYNKFSMPLIPMVIVLYGATVLPRWLQATDKHDRREILTRDMTAITALIVLSKILSRVISKACSTLSGFALSNTPHDHKDSLYNKIMNYLHPEEGVGVLNSDEITKKYSKLDHYKKGVSDFFTFIEEQRGDIKKVLCFDKKVRATSNEILGKDVNDCTYKEIRDGFEAAKGTEPLNRFYKAFESPTNRYVKRAKMYNSGFGFISTLILVPAFMVWLEKYNEKVTKRIIAKDKAKKAAAEQMAGVSQAPNKAAGVQTASVVQTAQNSSSPETKIAYSSFLGDK